MVTAFSFQLLVFASITSFALLTMAPMDQINFFIMSRAPCVFSVLINTGSFQTILYQTAGQGVDVSSREALPAQMRRRPDEAGGILYRAGRSGR